jgi:trk system potassium uptake protein TrkH
VKQLIDNKKVDGFFLIFSIVAILTLVIDYGFAFPKWIDVTILVFYLLYLVGGIYLTALKLIHKTQPNIRLIVFDVTSIIFILFCVFKQTQLQNSHHIITDWIRIAIIIKWIREIITRRINYKRSLINPAQLFIISFLLLILLGSFLLMLPNSTYKGISFIDALFTSTSAVCVTGLTVVDISSYYTHFGQTTIMLLIQAGGLGILTFASYFSYFFKGGATYENQLALNDISNSGKLGEVFTTLRRIIIITFLIEFIGAAFIYFNINSAFIPQFGERVYFSVFHSISSFCNAGFSTMPKGMMQNELIFNYPMQLVMVLIFVFGGLGFPIMINILRYLKYFIKRYILWFVSGENNYRAWVMTLSSKINLITTFALIVLGTLAFYIMEYSNVLASHNGFGKIITALFSATTPRSAGLNTIDFSSLHISTTMVIILLMWIGASPASTGGGIKTSTFAIATLNFISLAKGKSKIELFRREVADISVRRAFATMTLSFVAIGLGICFVTHFDRHLSLLDISFECVSAYCTVGLSLGITPELSESSKIVMIILMFTGRVTMLSILIAFFRKVRPLSYQYPTDEIMIN